MIAGPSGEAIESFSSGNTPFFLWNQVIFLVIQFYCCMGSFFQKLIHQLKHLLARSSSQIPFVHLELSHLQTSCPKGKRPKVLCRMSTKWIGLCDRPLSSFQGAAFAAESHFVKGGGTAVGDRGAAKSVDGCGRIGGREFIQASEGCCMTFLHVFCPTHS